METIYIQHPLRDITYRSRTKRYLMDSERQDLLRYRAAHDEVWQMKLRFEKATGDVLLAQNELFDMDYDREELEDIWKHYGAEIDFIDKMNMHTLEFRLQVELRDFYLEVRNVHRRIIRFYDRVAALESEYKDLLNKYYRSGKPIDPLNFTVLDDIFKFHDDRDTDIESLDSDLQQFLSELTAVYALFDEYIPLYSEFHDHYGSSLQKVDALVRLTQKLNNF